MNRSKKTLRNITIIFVGAFLFLGLAAPVKAEIYLTREEKNYIAKKEIIKAASFEGMAPLQYTDTNGEIKGISIGMLEKIAHLTGLIFEYKLYDSLGDILNDDYDLIFALSEKNAPANLALSRAFLKSGTIIYINSSLDPNKLEDKKYAAIKNSPLPEKIKEENIIYYNTMEESLNAVETGQADYGYGNAFSIAYYTLQNNYKNILTTHQREESKEYCLGIPHKNEILLSIINKAIVAAEENQMESLILDIASYINKKITLAMILDVYGKEIFGVTFLTICILLCGIFLNIRANKELELQNKRYELLSHISNECIFEYYIKNDHLRLSEKCIELFGNQKIPSENVNLIKDTLLNKNTDANTPIIKIPLADGRTGIFKVINSDIYDCKGKLHSIIGKLIDISKETAEKEKLITMSQIDGLTGLLNAKTTGELIIERIKNKNRNEIDAFILMDCDNFKNINDKFGHLAGNQVLKNLGNDLNIIFRKTDIIGRVGGDEFCVYMKNIPSISFIKTKCRQLNTTIQESDQNIRLSVSIGVSFPDGEKTYDQLFEEADNALYQAKKKGKAQAVIYGEQ